MLLLLVFGEICREERTPGELQQKVLIETPERSNQFLLKPCRSDFQLIEAKSPLLWGHIVGIFFEECTGTNDGIEGMANDGRG